MEIRLDLADNQGIFLLAISPASVAVLLPGVKPRSDRCHFPFSERARDSLASFPSGRLTLHTKVHQHYGSDDNI